MKITICLLSCFFALLFTPIFAIKKSYVVYMGGHSHGKEASSIDFDRVTNSHHEFLGSHLGSIEKAKDAIFYSYTRHINGFAAMLEDEEAAALSKHPGVVSVFLNRHKELHTTRSWNFLGLEHDGKISESSLWKKAKFGEDIIIGNIDSGVWPESESFSDEGMGPIPSRWKGTCQHGTDASFRCNRKLIGARYFINGFAAAAGALVNSSFYTPRDTLGHGSHTLSTAGGNFVEGANIFGYGNGTAKGGSPRARVAAYKACWPPIIPSDSCTDADVLAAFDMAIHDGVDVLSLSMGGLPVPYVNDSIAIGSFHAVKHGIVVVTSGGNSGAYPGTIANTAPWLITVGASTIDRVFASYVILGNNKRYRGVSLATEAVPHGKSFPIITGASAKLANATALAANFCIGGTLDPKKTKGAILVCHRGASPGFDKCMQATLVGAVGIVILNSEFFGNEMYAEPYYCPATLISYSDGLEVLAYLNSTRKPTAYITRPTTELGTKPAPIVAAFSSIGPNRVTPEILKPDIIAPGVSIIAAYTGVQPPTQMGFDDRRVKFNTMTGTSMSCPHVAGVVGLLKALHPTWSAAAIKSAIMTSARTRDNTFKPMTNSTNLKVTPFAYGAGNIWPNRAMDPGLVYDLTIDDYMSFLCAQGYNETQINIFSQGCFKCPEPISFINLNLPSITVPKLNDLVVVTRTLKNVGSPGIYKARIRSPAGISVVIEPNTLEFNKIGEEKSFKLNLKVKGNKAPKDYVFGQLIWSDGKHNVRSPIVVKAS
ncbi:PREDICTED: subtilisin-like protease SBT5.3 [Nicotiana attenuata]|uniref:subtilisin-like protease SBT5.3 n=1 Tax=Nicotiana attenuata TaxID=49451 RepID=UPI000905BDE9|nr:PREDICTED: subtilisin-like protease SBT5.3 [Nicotiana attenuata]